MSARSVLKSPHKLFCNINKIHIISNDPGALYTLLLNNDYVYLFLYFLDFRREHLY
jgi:hypothetical protein